MSDRRPENSNAGFDRESALERADRIFDAFEREWIEGREPRLADFLVMAPEAERPSLRRELELIEKDYRNRRVDPSALTKEREEDQDTPSTKRNYARLA